MLEHLNICVNLGLVICGIFNLGLSINRFVHVEQVIWIAIIARKKDLRSHHEQH